MGSGQQMAVVGPQQSARKIGIRHGDFGHGVRDDASIGDDADFVIGQQRSPRPIEMRAQLLPANMSAIVKVRGGGDRAIGQIHRRTDAPVRSADPHLPGVRAEETEIAARIDEARLAAMRDQRLDRTIHGMALCDPAEIDQQPAAAAEVGIVDDLQIAAIARIGVERRDAVPGEKSAANQFPANPDIEQAIARLVKVDGETQHGDRLPIEFDDIAGTAVAKVREIARFRMKGHALMNMADDGEGGADGLAAIVRGADLDEGSEQGLAAPYHLSRMPQADGAPVVHPAETGSANFEFI